MMPVKIFQDNIIVASRRTTKAGYKIVLNFKTVW
jgi:hypothetical protein